MCIGAEYEGKGGRVGVKDEEEEEEEEEGREGGREEGRKEGRDG